LGAHGGMRKVLFPLSCPVENQVDNPTRFQLTWWQENWNRPRAYQ